MKLNIIINNNFNSLSFHLTVYDKLRHQSWPVETPEAFRQPGRLVVHDNLIHAENKRSFHWWKKKKTYLYNNYIIETPVARKLSRSFPAAWTTCNVRQPSCSEQPVFTGEISKKKTNLCNNYIIETVVARNPSGSLPAARTTCSVRQPSCNEQPEFPLESSTRRRLICVIIIL